MPSPQVSHAQVAAILRRAKEIGARRDPVISTYLSQLENAPQDWAVAQTVSFMLDEYETENASMPNHLAAPPSLDDLYNPQSLPDALIGRTTETNVPYGPRMVENCGSIAISGITGGGKTSAILSIILGLLGLKRIAILVFDVKGDFNCIASLSGPGIRVHRLREEVPLRLIRPPVSLPLSSWLARVATYICEYRGLKKSRHLLLDRLTRLCAHFGVDQDPTKPWPSLFNVFDYLSGMKGSQWGKDAEYKASLVNEMKGLLEDSGRVFDTCDGIDVDEHFLAPGGITVLRMETLPAPAQQVVISLVVDRIIAARAARNIHNVPLEVLVVMDEAQQILSRRADFESSNGIAPLAMQLLRGRESGVGFIVAPHLLQEISQAVLSAAKTMLLVGGLSDSTSIGIAAQMMNLPHEARTMIPRLGRGQALVREIGLGNYTDAFLVNLDPPAIAKDAINELTRERLMTPKLAGLPVTPSKPLTDYPAIMAELHTSAAKHPPTTPSGGSAAAPAPLSQDEEELLLDCARHRDDWMKERRVRLNIRDYKVLVARAKILAGRGLVKLHDERLGRNTYSLVEVTDIGWNYLGKPCPPHYIGHGSLLHTVLISRVARHLAANKWTRVQTEFAVGGTGHPVDVFAFSPAGVPTAFEITLSYSNVVSNAVRTLTPGSVVTAMVFLCKVQDDCRKVEALLCQDPIAATLMGQIQVLRADGFIS